MPPEREAGRGGDRSDAGSVGEDEFRIGEITQRRPRPAVEMIEGDDVGLGAIRPGSTGGPGEIGQRVGVSQRHAGPWRERVYSNRSSRRNRHDTVESGTAEITIDRRRQIGRIGGNRGWTLRSLALCLSWPMRSR